MARRGRLEAQRDGRAAIRFDPLLKSAVEARADLAPLMEGQRALLAAHALTIAQETGQLEKRQVQIAAQIEGIAAQRAALGEELALIGRELDTQRDLLARGLAQAARVLALERERARLTGRAGELAAEAARAEGQMTEIGIEIVKLGARRREEAIASLSAQHHRELELREERRALLARMSRLEVRAPVAGVVMGLRVFGPRAVLRAAEPLMHIVPRDRPLMVSARVAATEVDRLYEGQPVILRLPGLDQRRTPELAGRVRRVSADAFEDSASRGSFYEVRVEIDAAVHESLPNDVRLMPGMPVEAYFRTADHTPMAYLVKPLADYFSRAMR